MKIYTFFIMVLILVSLFFADSMAVGSNSPLVIPSGLKSIGSSSPSNSFSGISTGCKWTSAFSYGGSIDPNALGQITAGQESNVTGCPMCELVQNYSFSYMNTYEDTLKTTFEVVVYYENKSASPLRQPVAYDPIIVFIDDHKSAELQLYRLYTKENGMATLNVSRYKKPGECYDFTFVSCPFVSGCGFYACLNATGLPIPKLYKNANLSDIPYHPDPPYYKPANPLAGNEFLPSIDHVKICPPPEVTTTLPAFCLPLFLILGLLMGALYYSGKNPMGSFDLTAPRLGSHLRYQARARSMASFDTMSMAQAVKGAVGDISGIAKGEKSVLGVGGKTTTKMGTKDQVSSQGIVGLIQMVKSLVTGKGKTAAAWKSGMAGVKKARGGIPQTAKGAAAGKALGEMRGGKGITPRTVASLRSHGLIGGSKIVGGMKGLASEAKGGNGLFQLFVGGSGSIIDKLRSAIGGNGSLLGIAFLVFNNTVLGQMVSSTTLLSRALDAAEYIAGQTFNQAINRTDTRANPGVVVKGSNGNKFVVKIPKGGVGPKFYDETNKELSDSQKKKLMADPVFAIGLSSMLKNADEDYEIICKPSNVANLERAMGERLQAHGLVSGDQLEARDEKLKSVLEDLTGVTSIDPLKKQLKKHGFDTEAQSLTNYNSIEFTVKATYKGAKEEKVTLSIKEAEAIVAGTKLNNRPEITDAMLKEVKPLLVQQLDEKKSELIGDMRNLLNPNQTDQQFKEMKKEQMNVPLSSLLTEYSSALTVERDSLNAAVSGSGSIVDQFIKLNPNSIDTRGAFTKEALEKFGRIDPALASAALMYNAVQYAAAAHTTLSPVVADLSRNADSLQKLTVQINDLTDKLTNTELSSKQLKVYEQELVKLKEQSAKDSTGLSASSLNVLCAVTSMDSAITDLQKHATTAGELGGLTSAGDPSSASYGAGSVFVAKTAMPLDVAVNIFTAGAYDVHSDKTHFDQHVEDVSAKTGMSKEAVYAKEVSSINSNAVGFNEDAKRALAGLNYVSLGGKFEKLAGVKTVEYHQDTFAKTFSPISSETGGYVNPNSTIYVNWFDKEAAATTTSMSYGTYLNLRQDGKEDLLSQPHTVSVPVENLPASSTQKQVTVTNSFTPYFSSVKSQPYEDYAKKAATDADSQVKESEARSSYLKTGYIKSPDVKHYDAVHDWMQFESPESQHYQNVAKARSNQTDSMNDLIDRAQKLQTQAITIRYNAEENPPLKPTSLDVEMRKQSLKLAAKADAEVGKALEQVSKMSVYNGDLGREYSPDLTKPYTDAAKQMGEQSDRLSHISAISLTAEENVRNSDELIKIAKKTGQTEFMGYLKDTQKHIHYTKDTMALLTKKPSH
ncbi:MAG: hypothetical protein ABID61_01595, partial [Candidatus Micrarchaeota archaeon]